ncbi:MAG: cytidyltransferase-related domain protein, partial [Lachnospiraceae bacterium]|nr:cytidyltransferase-related domain protein [Lachnospiraceae bacterium]
MNEIFLTLEKKMTSQQVLAQTGLTRSAMLEMLSDQGVRRRLAKLRPENGRYSCAGIYHCFEKVMKEKWDVPPGGWVKFTYDFVTHILYPEKAFTREYGVYARGAFFYLHVLQVFLDEERKSVGPEPFYDFELLTMEEAQHFPSGEEYETFLKLFRSQFIYEMMRLNLEVTTYKTLEHIAGVHYVAMTVARSLEQAKVPVDLALISASAAGHDLGKFGCKPGENVPYLHYFYTNAWFSRHGMPYIGHIAANHSTWDLEPDNLSLESLILIYSDFRVKSSRGKNGENITVITSLKDAFDVILHKLENVDEKKLARYRRVYAKLKNFEDYMEMKGVDTSLEGTVHRGRKLPEVTLQNGRQTIRSLTFMGVERGIDVMRRMVAERTFGNLLEAARSEKDWKNLRAYLDVFGRYIAYTNDQQKKQTLDFLYELLMHREGDICVEAAHLTGKIIAQFNFGYRKRRPKHFPDTDTRVVMGLWSDTMERIIRPDYRLTTVQQRRIRRSLKHALLTLVEYADAEDLKGFITCFMELFEEGRFANDAEVFVILDAVQILSATPLDEAQREKVGYYIAEKMRSSYRPVQVAAWRAARWLVDHNLSLESYQKIGAVAKKARNEEDSTLLFLQYRILSRLGEDTEKIRRILYERDRVSDIFLDNLKTATPWIVKAVNIKLLKDQVMRGETDHHLHIASHLSNLLKVSEHVTVRQDAGDALIEIMLVLKPDERNDIVVELVRGLEMGEYEFSKYVPAYLGKAALFLAPQELDEIVAHIYGLTSSPNTRVVASALDTASVLLCHYPEYRTRFTEDKEVYEARRDRLLGMILRGLSSYRTAVREEAMLDLSAVFSSAELKHAEKKQLFELSARKILFLLSEEDDTQITMFYRTAVLSEIMRFITECDLRGEALRIPMRKKVAFFPGTFDPFTLSHKGIARMIRDMDFEVYLAIDEFSWSKKVQPHLVRRRIVSMSVADEFHINLFPDDIPINIANPANLETLSRIFKGREVYMVVGSDVIANASSYKKAPVPHSIHHMNHIAFRRVGEDKYDSKKNPKMFKVIKKHVVELELPAHLEEISSSMIRENIDLNRDISNLIDPGVQEYIYGSG